MADSATALSITGVIPEAYVGVAYSFKPTVAGGDNTKYAFTAVGLPAGLAVDAKTGEVSGTPTTDGSDGVTITVTDGTSTEKLTGTIVVAPQIGIHGVPGAAIVGSAYSFKPTMTNVAADGKVVVTLANGAFLPAGLSLNADTGEVSGTPTEAKSVGFTLDVTDGHTSNSASFTIAVGAALAIVDNAEHELSLDVPYSTTLQVTGGPGGNIFWEVTSGTLPTGMKLSNVGVLSGTPTEAGVYTVTIKATAADNSFDDDIIEFEVLDDGKAEADGKAESTVVVSAQLNLAVGILTETATPDDGQKQNATNALQQAAIVLARTPLRETLDAARAIVAANQAAFAPANLALFTSNANRTVANSVQTLWGEFYNTLFAPTTTVLEVTALIRNVRRMDVVMYLRSLRNGTIA